MGQHSDDMVRLTTGPLVEIRAWGDVLQAAGIAYQVVGDHLVAELNSAPSYSAALWVHRADAEAAETAMAELFHNSLDDTRPE